MIKKGPKLLNSGALRQKGLSRLAARFKVDFAGLMAFLLPLMNELLMVLACSNGVLMVSSLQVPEILDCFLGDAC
jgi:hypothetical protein